MSIMTSMSWTRTVSEATYDYSILQRKGIYTRLGTWRIRKTLCWNERIARDDIYNTRRLLMPLKIVRNGRDEASSEAALLFMKRWRDTDKKGAHFQRCYCVFEEASVDTVNDRHGGVREEFPWKVGRCFSLFGYLLLFWFSHRIILFLNDCRKYTGRWS
jgi:hypothetical protein